ncbi:hypothetical protein LMH87_006196 [Akanthomyces muscarius]|uniref:Uncharacterized protein n=1 Tax=Akanthomyces muscarius TaxID=2231603 RepID=A0A9W8QQC1_AKAMU|nr:hypothetical protein LMH87_006196 [Akanthomyces muscarius]KAJ4164524.1 hypothetical protein LMH87_006196 [Akanthomyces muscarius]
MATYPGPLQSWTGGSDIRPPHRNGQNKTHLTLCLAIDFAVVVTVLLECKFFIVHSGTCNGGLAPVS